MPDPVNKEEPEDLVDSMLKKTGCLELHYKVQVRFMAQFPILLHKTIFFLGVRC